MKQVLQDRNGTTSVRDVPLPPCPTGGVLVRTAFSAISSGTERARVEVSQKSLLGKARERPELAKQVMEKARAEGLAATRVAVRQKLLTETPVGYSNSGEIIEVGIDSRGFSVGDRVACCGGGHANHAEVCSMPGNLVARVPHGVSLVTASLTTISSVALHGVRLSGATLGDRVAVIGAGLVGQIACCLLRAQGCEVFAIEPNSRRLEYALEHGVDHGFALEEATSAVSSSTGGVGVDRVLVTAGSKDPAPLQLATEIVRDRGSVVLLGSVPIELKREPMYDKEIEFRVSRSYGPGRYDLDYEERGLDYPIGYVRWTEKRNMEAILGLMARGALSLEHLVDVVLPVGEAESAYGRLVAPDNGEAPLGAIVLSYDASDNESPVPEIVGRSVSEPSPNRSALSSTRRLGLVGPGSFASRILVPAFVEAGVSLELVGGGGASVEAAQRRLSFKRVAQSAVEVCEDPNVEIVALSSRHGSHAPLTKAALDAGKHVFCEKPLALTVDELDQVIESAERSQHVLAVGFNRRFAPMVQRMREHIAIAGGPISAGYRVSAGQLPLDHWIWDPDQGGGRLLGEVCHFIDTLRYLVGHPISEVFAMAHGSPDTPVANRDCLVVMLTFEDGSIGEVTYVSQGSSRVAKERLEVFGNGGRTAVLDDFRTLELFSGSKRDRQSAKKQDKGHRSEVAEFVRATSGSGTQVPVDEISNVSYATLAAQRSLEIGVPVKIRTMKDGDP